MFLFLLCYTSADLWSQNKKEAVVLYNTQAVKAVIDVPSKEIDYIISYEDDFLKGFRLEIPDYEKYLRENSTSSAIAQANVVDKTTAEADEGMSQQPPQSKEDDKSVFSYIKFQKGFATLSDEAIRLLESVLDEYEKSPGKIILRALSDSEDNMLSKNRAQAVKTYLKIRGLDADMISIQLLRGPRNLDDIMIVFPENDK
jgi:hypothetical protein